MGGQKEEEETRLNRGVPPLVSFGDSSRVIADKNRPRFAIRDLFRSSFPSCFRDTKFSPSRQVFRITDSLSRAIDPYKLK